MPSAQVDAALTRKDHHDVSEHHTARDALNVAIELEEENTVQETGARVGVESYWALHSTLGSGTVLITKDERDFFQLLRSHEGLDTDLNSKQPYILRQRKPQGKQLKWALLSALVVSSHCMMNHEESQRVWLSPRHQDVKLQWQPRSTSLSHSPREILSLPQGLSEPRHADFTPIAPSTPRPSQSRNRSPRFSTALNKLIR
ncbi:hypothetical protein GQ600_19914 [Phytophthora cactorum]|nr:hypothetical protein GQ600_19914 [Phytophthora cactorum]